MPLRPNAIQHNALNGQCHKVNIQLIGRNTGEKSGGQGVGTRRIRSDVSLMLASMSLVWVTSSYLIKVTLTSEPQEKFRVPRGGEEGLGEGGMGE